jgi:hypothetical protein
MPSPMIFVAFVIFAVNSVIWNVYDAKRVCEKPY